VQSLEEASFDAWIKLYRPDANTANSTVSYYRKGEVACFLLDATIRAATGGAKGLDDVQSRLWDDHGRLGKAVPEGAFPEVFKRVTGVDVSAEHGAWVRGTEELPVDAVLAKVGLRVVRKVKAEGITTSLGLRTNASRGRVTVTTVLRGGAAERAGISPADELVAIEGWRVDEANLDQHLRGHEAGDELRLLVVRDGRAVEATVTLDTARPEVTAIEPMADATDEQRAIVASWLGGLPAAWTPKAPKSSDGASA
jgi:predicted metalloprotease with PDZ domain